MTTQPVVVKDEFEFEISDVQGRAVKVTAFSDGSIRFEVGGGRAYAITETALQKNEQGKVSVTLSPGEYGSARDAGSWKWREA